MTEEPDTVNDYMAALGMVAVSSTVMEHSLREAFCSLVGSKFAAIVAGGQAVAWLIDQCGALIDAHRELPDTTRQTIQDRLQLCREANNRRNDLMHGLMALSETGLEALRSRKHTHVLTLKTWNLSKIQSVNRALVAASSDLRAIIMSAFGPEVVELSETLRLEDRITQQDT